MILTKLRQIPKIRLYLNEAEKMVIKNLKEHKYELIILAICFAG